MPQVFRLELTDYNSLPGRVKKVLFYYKDFGMNTQVKANYWCKYFISTKYEQRYAGCGTLSKASADN